MALTPTSARRARRVSGHAAKVEADIAEAMKRYRIRAPWTAEPGAAYTSGFARCLHSGEGQGRRGHRSREHRSLAPLH